MSSNSSAKARSSWRLNLTSLGLVLFASFLTTLTQGRDGDQTSVSSDPARPMKAAHDDRTSWRDVPEIRADVQAVFDGVSVEGKLLVSSSGDINLSPPAR